MGAICDVNHQLVRTNHTLIYKIKINSMPLVKSMYIFVHFLLFHYKNIATLSQAVNL